MTLNRGVMTRDRSLFPDFLILGVQKSSTTTLFDVLNRDSNFSGSIKKEIHFFDEDKSYNKGLDWYLDFFDGPSSSLRFEATPSYIYSKKSAGRIFNKLGPMKFIVILRDPVKRCFSSWNMFRQFNSNPEVATHIYETFIVNSNQGAKESLHELLFTNDFPSFEQSVSDDISRYKSGAEVEEPSFVRRGFYFEQITNYLSFFELDDFLFLEQEDFNNNLFGNLEKISKFLGVKIDLADHTDDLHSNRGEYGDLDLSKYENTFSMLYDFYSDHNKKLFSLTGKEYPWNSFWVSQ